ncbi:MAG: TIGR03960 family B12-binding radical SAM protein [Lachnospiraceae bacterium]|nr:TIGR03960 family B12-binding radical SAM protein [Lachnospiraceae bacterium]
MADLALSHEILMQVDKPARYIGNEINAVHKEKGSYRIHFAMCFPDVYEIGMSHLGMPIIYDMLNKRDDVYCERVYAPWTDLDKVMREKGIRLFSLESQEELASFDFIGFTLQYEMCYTTVLQVLDLSGIPLLAKDRTDGMPLIIGGGPCAYNPEPVADFFDLFYIGEGETVYYDLMDLYNKGLSRQDFLREASHIEGIYVPSLYNVTYNDDGTLAAFEPLYDDVPRKVKKQTVMDLSDTYYPDKMVIPYIKTVQDRITLEIMRGCIRGCRFCQAGAIYRPTRERSLDFLKKKALSLIKSSGHEEITLSSLSSSDYRSLKELMDFLMDACSAMKLNISLPSLRIDAFSLDIMKKVQDIKKSSLTFAPEAGTQRMRDVINKGLTVEDIMGGAMQAFQGGWNKVKLYFMLGLPHETIKDIEGIAELCNDIAALFYTIPKDERPGNKRVEITASTSYFVPKPFTPFQWERMDTPDEFDAKQKHLSAHFKEMLNKKSIRYIWHDSETTKLEGIFARGDRRLSAVILKAYEHGCFFDAWTELFKYDVWMKAFEECGIDPDFYISRKRPFDELLPWDFIDAGVTKAWLIREAERAEQGVVTPNCRTSCSGCGCRSMGGGVCFEDQDQIQ